MYVGGSLLLSEKKEGFPQRLGHEPAGTIVEVGSRVKNWRTGDRVTGIPLGLLSPKLTLRAFATHATADPTLLVKVPDAVPLKFALGEPLKCVVTIWTN